MKASLNSMVKALGLLSESPMVSRVSLIVSGRYISNVSRVHFYDQGSAIMLAEVIGERLIWHWFQTEAVEAVEVGLNSEECARQGVEDTLLQVLTHLKSEIRKAA